MPISATMIAAIDAEYRMTYYVMTLAVSAQVVEVARRIAETTTQSIEAVLQQQLEDSLLLPRLPVDEEAELAALRCLSDDTLWTIAAEQMSNA
jgi:hypothetical protein